MKNINKRTQFIDILNFCEIKSFNLHHYSKSSNDKKFIKLIKKDYSNIH